MLISFFINIIQISLAVVHLSLLAAFLSNVTANFIFTNRLRLVHCISESEQYYRVTLKLKNMLYYSRQQCAKLPAIPAPLLVLSHPTQLNHKFCQISYCFFGENFTFQEPHYIHCQNITLYNTLEVNLLLNTH